MTWTLGLKCAPIASIRLGFGGLGPTTGGVTDTGLAGNSGGGARSDLLWPPGFAVTGALGSFTGSINALAGHCARIGGGGTSDTAYGGTPRPDGTAYDGLCPAGTAVTGFWPGRRVSRSAHVQLPVADSSPGRPYFRGRAFASARSRAFP